MRKLYPPPFKFAVLVLYGLLSIAVITLAQDEGALMNQCGMNLKTPRKYKTMGYINLFKEPRPIQWELYDYINVIGKKGKFLHFA
jgi:hypothetical protein